MFIKIIVALIAGLGAGVSTGIAGLSAATVISPMLITFLGIPAYQAVGIALASDVLASAISAYTYKKNKNIDIKNGVVMLAFVLLFTLVGSWIASLMPDMAMGNFSLFGTLAVGIKFLVMPVTATKERTANKSAAMKFAESAVCGIVIGFICGFMGAGGGMMMLIILTSVLGYELKTAVGTSVFIMTFTALTGAVSHIAIGGIPDILVAGVCIVTCLSGAYVSAIFANKADPKTLNRVTGILLVVLALIMIAVKML